MFELDRIRRRTLPPASIALGAVTLALYAVECIVAKDTSPRVDQLLALGASEQRAIWEHHELWRLLCPAFLHASLMHIAMNGYSFIQLAPFVERVWGWSRFLAVYVVSAIAGAAVSSRGGHAVSVGASGALFGLMGFLIVAAYSGAHRHEVRTIVKKTWGQGLLISVGGVLAYGLTPGSPVDNLAHLGGLFAGALLGLMLSETDEEDRSLKFMGGAAALAIVAAWVALALGLKHGERFDAEWRAANVAFARRDFEAAAASCETVIALDVHDPRMPLVFWLEGKAYLRGGHLDEASWALERAWLRARVPDIAAALVEVSVRRGDMKAARSWAAELERCAAPGELAAMTLEPETRAAIAQVASR